MCSSNGPVVTIEKAEQIFGQVSLVQFAQCPHDTEVNRSILTIGSNKDVTWVHVSVKKPITKCLCKKDFYTIVCQLLHIYTSFFYRVDIAYRYAIDLFHNHNVTPAMLPVDLRHVDKIGVKKIVAQLGCICCFPHQIKFVMNRLIVVFDDFHWAQSFRF